MPDESGADPALLSAFGTNVRAAASDYREVAGWAEVIAEIASGCRDSEDRRVALTPDLVAGRPSLMAAFAEAGLEVIVPASEDPVPAIADVPVGVVQGRLGVAETGSVLVEERSLADRVITMLCQRLIQVVESDTVVARLEDVARWLSQHASGSSFFSLITGPSRTADIERSLTIGVQGPQEVSVRVLLDGPRTGPTVRPGPGVHG